MFHLDPAYRITVTPTEIIVDGPRPVKALENALEAVEQLLEEKQASVSKGVSLRLPMSGNDKKVMVEILRELGKRDEGIDALSFLKLVKDNLRSVVSSNENFRLIEILKPEFYEHNRVPGYSTAGLIKSKKYPLSSIALALCGYLGCAVGRTLVGVNDYVTVVVTPLTSSTERGFTINAERIISHQTGYKDLSTYVGKRKGRLAGLFPESALHLLMASLMRSTSVSVYAIREPGGSAPASIFTSMTMRLDRTYAELRRCGIIDGNGVADDFHGLLEVALDATNSGSERAAAIRYSVLLYEVIHGLKPYEEFVYTVDREFMRWVLMDTNKLPNRGDKDFNLYMLQRRSLRIARKLSRAI
ncbi:MAG: hypothetical protein RMJ30_01675 [Nitrososphaerota archaeon]|nr:hypothetical protein [Nitrososphaerota archaeon]